MMREWAWSQTEKRVARKAFDAALNGECEWIIAETKERAARITEIQEVWKLEEWIGERGKEISSKFDYRYSRLPIVIARLLCEGRLTPADLLGLAPEKIDYIQTMAQYIRDH